MFILKWILRKIWGLKSIAEGWINKNKHFQYSKDRLKICTGCSEAKPRQILRILNGSEIWEYSLQCTKCKCPCLEKSLVQSEKCPLGKWP